MMGRWSVVFVLVLALLVVTDKANGCGNGKAGLTTDVGAFDLFINLKKNLFV